MNTGTVLLLIVIQIMQEQGMLKHVLHYTDVVSFNDKKLRTTIGGTGLAVSSFSKHKDIAVDFASMVVSGECQRTLYVQHGGQPGHRSAWIDAEANRLPMIFSEMFYR